ncbi:hypothetical protein [Absidia glauca]|uniref:Uncharacterized protein n=1 Tax=Absidia glauca TaxID=4829 RepID=A0A168MLF9_ABSGL|nr:hypothetical protein [Absidia glauca]
MKKKIPGPQCYFFPNFIVPAEQSYRQTIPPNMSPLKTHNDSKAASPIADSIPKKAPSPIQKKQANIQASRLRTITLDPTMVDSPSPDIQQRPDPSRPDPYFTVPQRLFDGLFSSAKRDQVLNRVEDSVPDYLCKLDKLRQVEQQNLKTKRIVSPRLPRRLRGEPSRLPRRLRGEPPRLLRRLRGEPSRSSRRLYGEPPYFSAAILAERIRRHLVETLDPTSTHKTQRFFELGRILPYSILRSVGSSSDNPIDLVSLDEEPTLQQIEEPTSVDNPIIVSDEELSDLDEGIVLQWNRPAVVQATNEVSLMPGTRPGCHSPPTAL